jgi:hypothetical protein
MSTPYTSKKPMHPHRELIIAWANGAEIQQYTENRWKDCTYPVWDERVEYRIKPYEPTLPYNYVWALNLKLTMEKDVNGIIKVQKVELAK